MKYKELITAVDQYYSGKLLKHGATPAGVDWNSEESQKLRFEQLLFVAEDSGEQESILDYGCGYGGLCGFLREIDLQLSYTGFDISKSMIARAKELYPGNSEWISSLSDKQYDYVVASGIFNVVPEGKMDEWKTYMFDTIEEFGKLSRNGFAFNVLSMHSDPEKRNTGLFYAHAHEVFDFCMTRWPRRVALLHDYGLYEFTIVVHTG